MLSALLADTADTTTAGNGWVTWVILAVFIAIIVVFFVISSRRNKKRQQEADQLMNAVKPGNKVKTIGGVCGIVVEVDNEENTFVLETGSEKSGKCYMKFDKQAIYQTDAVVDKAEEKKEEPKAEEPFEEHAAEEAKTEEKAEPADEEKPADEADKK
ncbi:MAG TPA: preprotein translocase subunit YajC [Candidatus Coproplasma excrementavium]|nr:preprotein translocase subunit YajC [Candidatus Coproplasma excrementavium]